MSQRKIICIDCDGVIQENTPLALGGTTLPVPGLCDSCRQAREDDQREENNEREKNLLAGSPALGSAEAAMLRRESQ